MNYDRHPTTTEGLLEACLGQVARMDEPGYEPSLHGVQPTPQAIADLCARVLALEAVSRQEPPL